MPENKKEINRKVNFNRRADIAFDSLSDVNKILVKRSIDNLSHRMRLLPDNKFIKPITGMKGKYSYRTGGNADYFIVFVPNDDQIEIEDIISKRVVELYKADNNEKISGTKI